MSKVGVWWCRLRVGSVCRWECRGGVFVCERCGGEM